MKRLPSFSLCSEVVFMLPWQQRKLFKLQRRECWEERKKMKDFWKDQDQISRLCCPANSSLQSKSNIILQLLQLHCLSSSSLLLLKHFKQSAASECLPLCCSRINSALLFPQYYVCWAAKLIHFPFSCREKMIFSCVLLKNSRASGKLGFPLVGILDYLRARTLEFSWADKCLSPFWICQELSRLIYLLIWMLSNPDWIPCKLLPKGLKLDRILESQFKATLSWAEDRNNLRGSVATPIVYSIKPYPRPWW